MAATPPVPQPQAFVSDDRSLATDALNFLIALCSLIASAAVQRGKAALTGQTAAISTTPLPSAPLNGTLYRLSYSLRVATAASVSSSVALTVGWTNGASVSCSQSFTAVTGNTSATQQSAVIVMDVLAASTVSYSTAYASVGTPMSYALDIRLEELP
jgi:hypothetical protein